MAFELPQSILNLQSVVIRLQMSLSQLIALLEDDTVYHLI